MKTREQALNDLDPRWTARIYGDTTGEDFLGLGAESTNIVGYLLPGITTITPRARYYPFYSWVLTEYAERHPEGMSPAGFIKRREQIFGLANRLWVASRDDRPSETGLLGTNEFGRHLERHRAAHHVPLTADDYLGADYGGYGQYNAVMRTLGLIRQEGDRDVGVLPKAQELGRAFAKAVSGTRYYKLRLQFDTAGSIPRDVLKEYGACCRLSGLDSSPDRLPTLEALFAFDSRKILPEGSELAVGNMKGTLGLILDMTAQTERPLTDDRFRQAAAFGLCSDYEPYQPSDPLRPILEHWQMFQLREYYVFALYGLWVHFLSWLRREGPAASSAYEAHAQGVDLATAAAALDVVLPTRSLGDWTLAGWLQTLLHVAGVGGEGWESQSQALAQKSRFPLNEHALYRLLRNTQPHDAETHMGAAWSLLSIVYLRLRGLHGINPGGAWRWARAGGARRRSLDLFVRGMDQRLQAGDSVLDTWSWLQRDYVIAQHIITALEKWRARKVNTFHFNYENGVFEWVRDDRAALSASRFRQASTMLADLGLYQIDSEGQPRLTELGEATLHRVLEACRA
jgi:hypothetical protein